MCTQLQQRHLRFMCNIPLYRRKIERHCKDVCFPCPAASSASSTPAPRDDRLASQGPQPRPLVPNSDNWPVAKYALRSQGFCSDHQCGERLTGCCPRPCNHRQGYHYLLMHVEKTGGSSVECALQAAADRGLVDLMGHSNYSASKACQARCGDRRVVRILTVRNPFTYWESVYKYAWKCLGNRCPSQERSRLVQDPASGVKNDFSAKGVLISFASFLRFVSMSRWWVDMTLSERIFTKCGRPCKYDTLLHTESLSKDWSRLLVQHPHLPRVRLSHVNKGGGQAHHPWGPPPPVSYTPELVNIVQRLESVVFETFDYHPWPPLSLHQDLFVELNGNYSMRLYGSTGQLNISTVRVLWANLLPPDTLKRIIVRCGSPIENAAGPLLYVRDTGNHYQSQAVWVHRSMAEASVADIYANNTWVEVAHCGWLECNVSLQTPMWFLASPGSGARVNIGRSIVISGHKLLHLALVKGDALQASAILKSYAHGGLSSLDSVQFRRFTGSHRPGRREWVNEIVMLRMFSEPDSLINHLPSLRCGPSNKLRKCQPTDAAVKQMATCGQPPQAAMQSVLKRSDCPPNISSSWGNPDAPFRRCSSWPT